MEPQQEGITRALTPGEVNLARSVFGSTRRACGYAPVGLSVGQ